MSCAIFTLPAARKGCTWDGLSASLSSDGTSFANELSSVKMVFKLAGSDAAALTRTSADDHITITDAAAWTFTVEEFAMTLAAGTYAWFIETTDSAGRVKVYYSGTIEVTEDGTP